MIEEILKFFLGELKRLDTHYNNQMRGFGNKIKTQRAELIKYQKGFKLNKVKTPKTDLQYREYCIVKDGIINKLNEKMGCLIEGNNFRDGHIGKLKAHVKKLQVECSNLMIDESRLTTQVELLTGIETNLNEEIKVLYEERERGDNPEWDCTDAAHPAWWRGEKYSYLKFCERVTEFLDGKGFVGKGHKEIETIKRRIQEMLVEEKATKKMNALLVDGIAEIKEDRDKWKNQSESLSKTSSFKKEYDPKWEKAYRDMKKQNEKLVEEAKNSVDKINMLVDERQQLWDTVESLQKADT